MKQLSLAILALIALILGNCSTPTGTAPVAASPTVSPAVTAMNALESAQATDYFVSRSEDDAEEGVDGQVDLTNEDLDLGQLSGFESAKAVGIRFDGIRIPKGRKIKRAFLQFTKEGNRTKAKPTELTIRAELARDAESFKKEAKNISSRRLTKASVKWSPEPWNPKQARDERPRTPDLSGLIQEVVDQNDWQTGNAIVLIITGTGERDAVSFDGGGKQYGPMLHIEFD